MVPILKLNTNLYQDKSDKNNPSVYVAPLSEYRYYAGNIGKQKIHLVYWPSEDYSEADKNNYFYVGKMVYDNVSKTPMDISIDFTSGGAMDGGATINNKVVAEFSNKMYANASATLPVECKNNEEVICGQWNDSVQKIDAKFIFTPTYIFKIEDFLKKNNYAK